MSAPGSSETAARPAQPCNRMSGRDKYMTQKTFLWTICLAGWLAVYNGCASEPSPPMRPPVPPPAFAAPPSVVLIADMPGVYWVQDSPNLFFYGDAWYYYYGGWWYCSSFYNGPWIFIETVRVPEHFYRIPPGYFRPAAPPPHPRAPAYRQKQPPDGHRGGNPPEQPGRGHDKRQKH